MNLNHATNKENGSTLSAQEWNSLAADVNELGAGGANNESSFLYMNDKGNLCLETTAENTPAGKKGKINIEANDDIQIKPGDDIMLYGDHRGEGKTDEVSIKVMDGTGENDVPAKLQVNMSEITLTTKDKAGADAGVLDINVNKAKNTKGYLKVRAQAIDLRCEANGGIALQPKGNDGDGNENKIKFEHNGGDGKEFGTFNTEKTSIFTDEYRFKGDGNVYAVTRGALETTYKVDNDPSSGVKKIDYPTQGDDFKDIPVTEEGSNCTWDSTNGWEAPAGENILSCTWNDIIVAVNYIKSQNPSLAWTQPAVNL